jgi:hypothetical protein
MTLDGIRYTKRTDAGQRLQQLTAQMEDTLLKSSHRRLQPGELGGFAVTVTGRVLGSMNVIMTLDGAWRGGRRVSRAAAMSRPRHAPAARRLASEGPGAV